MRFGYQRLALPAAGENQLTKRETAIVQNQLKNAQSPCRPVHALLGTFSSFKTKPNEQIIIAGGGPDGVGCDKNTTNAEALIGFDLLNELIAQWVNSIHEASFQAYPYRFFRAKNVSI